MRYATLCSGIEGFGAGFDQVPGMECVFQCEIEAAPRRILERHYPDVPRTEDVTSDETADAIRRARPELVAFGSPCQDLSVAGRRAGLDGERSGLFFRCVELALVSGAKWLLWENVPGALSSNKGKDFASVIEAMSGVRPEVPSRGWKNWGFGVGPLGGIAWRILDAQWFGVAQRRRRVFVVVSVGNRTGAAEILFEPESVPWDPPPCRETGSHVAGTLDAGAGVRRGAGVNPAGLTPDVAASTPAHLAGVAVGVRRLLPVEYERLQGFRDGYTEHDADGKPLSDAARYKMLGNSIAVPVSRWLGERLMQTESTDV